MRAKQFAMIISRVKQQILEYMLINRSRLYPKGFPDAFNLICGNMILVKNMLYNL